MAKNDKNDKLDALEYAISHIEDVYKRQIHTSMAYQSQQRETDYPMYMYTASQTDVIHRLQAEKILQLHQRMK